MKKFSTFTLLSSVAVLMTGCLQDKAAPVEFRGNEVYTKQGRFDLQGNELPKYSEDNPAQQDAKIADKYVGKNAEYGVAAKLDDVSTTDITQLNSGINPDAYAAVNNGATPAQDAAATVQAQAPAPAPVVAQESFFDRMKRGMNDVVDSVGGAMSAAAAPTATPAPVAAAVAAPAPVGPVRQELATRAPEQPKAEPENIYFKIKRLLNKEEAPAAKVESAVAPLVVAEAAPLPPMISPNVVIVAPNTTAPAQPLTSPAMIDSKSIYVPAPQLDAIPAPKEPTKGKEDKSSDRSQRKPINDAIDTMAQMNAAMEKTTAHLAPAKPVAAMSEAAPFVEQPKMKPAKPVAAPAIGMVEAADVPAPSVAPAPAVKPVVVQEAAKTVVASLETPKVETPKVVAPKVVTPEPKEEAKEELAPLPLEDANIPANKGMVWPVKGTVASKFGQDVGGRKNDGINILANKGDAIHAAGEGVVVYADSRLKGYGNMIIIQHPNGYLSAYAHADGMKVKKGDKVKQGQTIATVGQSGGVDKPQVHFALRKDKLAVDPQAVLGK